MDYSRLKRHCSSMATTQSLERAQELDDVVEFAGG